MSISSDLSRPASGDLSSYQYYFVTVNSSGQLARTGDGARADGILQTQPGAQGRAGTYRPAGTESFVVAGASFTAGDELGSDSAGRAVTGATDDVMNALALEDASGAGSIVRCLVRDRGVVG